MSNDLRSLADVDRLIHEPSRSGYSGGPGCRGSADFLYLQRETGLTKAIYQYTFRSSKKQVT